MAPTVEDELRARVVGQELELKELRRQLGDARANVYIDWEARREIEKLREALRPFADGYRKIKRMLPIPHGLGYHNAFTMQDLANAAELLPEATSPPPSAA